MVHTVTNDWSDGTKLNVDAAGDRLDLATVANQVDDWYRHPYNQIDWEAQAEKDTSTVFSEGDRCLRDSDNGTINGPTVDVTNSAASPETHEFRTGLVTKVYSGTQYVASVPATTEIPLPTGMSTIDEVRFLTGGARIAETSYTVRFHYSDTTISSVSVPIRIDTTTGAARNRSGVNYTIAGITSLTHNANPSWDADTSTVSDCAGGGGDDVIVSNPQPAKNLDSIEFEYVEYGDAGAASGWLGGPIAVSLVTDEAEIENTFTYRGEYLSPTSTSSADVVNAGSNAIWYRMSWSASNLGTDSEILVHVTCGNDGNSNNTLDAGELATERTYTLSGLVSPYTLPTQCTGRYLRYRVEIIDSFTDSPRLNDITFTYDPDADSDGFGDDGNATTNDCNDGNAAINPSAAEIPGDNVDQNCDTRELCYTDGDNDNARLATTFLTTLGDTNCTGANEGLATDPIDCNDGNSAINPAATELPSDSVDQNCDTQELCYRDNDNDGARLSTTVTSTDLDCTDAQEGVTADPIDCDDNNNQRSPLLAETAGDNVDGDCNDREFCYTDADNDNARLTTTFQTVVGDHNCTGANEGLAADPLDCDDGDATVNPAATEVVGNNKDDDCNGRATCYDDDDNDGARLNTSFQTNAGDTNCSDPFEGETGDAIDCNDTNAAIRPGIAEVTGNNQDDNCDNVEDCFVDGDNDNNRTATVDPGGTVVDSDCNDANEGLASDAIDCNDANPAINSFAVEGPGDNVDQNCDTRELCYTDADNDNARLTTTFQTALNDTNCTGANEGLAADPLDCNDGNAAINPFASEITGDSVDQNCDTTEVCWDDADNDGNRHGTNTRASTDTDCGDANEGLTSDPVDCADNDAQRFIGNTETPGNEKDNDCNNQEICYADADNDDTRHPSNTIVSADQDCQDANEAPTAFLQDCDDNDNTAFPGNTEITGNNNDNNCDGIEVCYADADNDTFRHTSNTVNSTTNENCTNNGEGEATDGIDCNDANSQINPAMPEGVDLALCGNGIDDNCDNVGNYGFPNYLDDDGDTLTYSTEQSIGGNDCDNDTDNDGLRDEVEHNQSHTIVNDADSDNDNVNDSIEVGATPTTPRNTDGDALIDALDNDDDNDGLLSNLEDTDNDGNPFDDDNDLDSIKNMWDTDDDQDGVSTRNENVDNDATWSDDNADGDTLPDWIDPDDDNDGILTVNENVNGINDARDDNTDGDGLPDYRDSDDDGDSVLTANENVNGVGDARDDNTDGDALPNYRDTDDDGDTITTINEYADGPNRDVDGDGTQNHLDLDSDADGYNDQVEGRVASDTDTTYDYLDTDSDNDSVLDINELNTNTDGTAGANRIDNEDDGDGILTINEYADGPNRDVDGDSVQNHLDLDSDADGYTDQYEGRVASDTDTTYDYLDTDSDNDTLLDINEIGTQASPANSDGDALTNRIDPDDDGDCVRTRDEIGNPAPGLHSDYDGDSVFNYLDTDDDDDGEGTCSEDVDGDGNPHDDNTDGDGQLNYLDDDDDNDGILTAVENVQSAGRNPDGDALANHIDTDSDGDGWFDLDESTSGILDNFDGDDDPDFVDTDSDDDDVPDNREGSSSNQKDTDFDGFIDRNDTDDDDDQILTIQECSTSCANGLPWDDDFDGDEIADFVDFDDDNDGVSTFSEDVDGSGDPRDDNSDASSRHPDVSLDYLDTDDDGDGLLTFEEDPDLDALPENDDTDGDSLPNYRDEDDDGDALFTFDETELHDAGFGSDDPRDYDYDNDGIPNYLDADDDNDGVGTFCEIGYGVDHLWPDVDGDTIRDGDEWYNFIYLVLVLGEGEDIPEEDYNDNNGGLSGLDCLSPWDRDSDGLINALDSDDDGDGLSTGIDEPAIDLDCLPGTAVPAGDGIPAYVDRDSDNDGVVDDASGAVGEGFGDGDGDNIFDFLDCDNSGANGDSDVDGIRNGDEDDFICSGREVQIPCSLNPDVDSDGVIDGVEVGANVAAPKNTDNDPEPDVWDKDDDNDSRASALENGIIGCSDLDGDGEPNLWGIPVLDDSVDPALFQYWTFRCEDATNAGTDLNFDFGGNDLSDYPNTDRSTGGALPINPDTNPDFLDEDDDGDGTPSIEEGMGDVDGDGVPNAYDLYDYDGPDADPDGDGIISVDETDIGTNPYDDDSDGDGIGDAIEIGGDLSAPLDSDLDGTIDALDTDDDNDGIPTLVEGATDPDGDGIPSYLDPNSDNDTQDDSAEGSDDADCDGVMNFHDAVDSDGPCMSGDEIPNEGIYENKPGCDGCNNSGSPSLPLLISLAFGAALTRRRRAA